jgi:hypothetical protein
MTATLFPSVVFVVFITLDCLLFYEGASTVGHWFMGGGDGVWRLLVRAAAVVGDGSG